MNNFEALTKALGLVNTLIVRRQGAVSQSLVKAAAALQGLAVSVDEQQPLPEAFQMKVADIVSALGSFHSGVAFPVFPFSGARIAPPFDYTTKSFDNAGQVAAFVREQIEKAIGEDAAASLVRLHGLKAQIEAALAKGALDGNFTFAVQNDPLQVKTTEAAGSVMAEAGKSPDTQAVTAPVGEPVQTPTPAASYTSKAATDAVVELGKAADAVEKADTQVGVGWTHDLNSRAFLTGERRHDFGKDGQAGNADASWANWGRSRR